MADGDAGFERKKLGWSVPRLPRGIVAFKEPLQKLKAKVLANIDNDDNNDNDDDDGNKMEVDDTFDVRKVVVVSAAGGCGKTTLVKMLCHDSDIQEKFGTNVFFVTVSETPNFMVIVDNLFNPNSFSQQVPFQSSEDAQNKLERFFRENVSEDQRIPASALLNMWVHLYNHDDEGIDTLAKICELSYRNLVSVTTTDFKKDLTPIGDFCEQQFVTQHDLLRQLAINLNSKLPIAQRPRLLINAQEDLLTTNVPGQDLPASLESVQEQMQARILSISTGESFSSRWCDMKLPEVEVLVLNLIDNLNVWPKLAEIEMDYCQDLVDFPSVLCSSVYLKKVSITNCNEMSEISEEFGKLTNLEVLCLRSCTKLEKLPESITNIQKLSILDISDCLSLSELPEEIGNLVGLRTIYMKGCSGIHELPSSVEDLSNIQVTCNEEISYQWKEFSNVEINVVEEDRLETLMRII
nr:probable disease resistance protein At5g66900 [Tanacetum cinerariifolium]